MARLQLLCVEREEVGALPSLDVDDLDVLPCLHLVRERRRAIDLEVEPGVGEGLGQPRRELLERSRACDLELEIGRRRAALDDVLGCTGCAHDDEERPLGAKGRLGAGRRRRPEEHRGTGARRVDAARSDGVDDLGGAVLVRADERAKDGRVAVRTRPEPVEPVGAETEGRDLGSLPTVEVADREPVVRLEEDRRRRAAAHAMSLARRVARNEPRDEQARTGRHGQAFAGSFASWASASATSCSASSRLPAESSFLISFSTARRLYDWFQ